MQDAGGLPRTVAQGDEAGTGALGQSCQLSAQHRPPGPEPTAPRSCMAVWGSTPPLAPQSAVPRCAPGVQLQPALAPTEHGWGPGLTVHPSFIAVFHVLTSVREGGQPRRPSHCPSSVWAYLPHCPAARAACRGQQVQRGGGVARWHHVLVPWDQLFPPGFNSPSAAPGFQAAPPRQPHRHSHHTTPKHQSSPISTSHPAPFQRPGEQLSSASPWGAPEPRVELRLWADLATRAAGGRCLGVSPSFL